MSRGCQSKMTLVEYARSDEASYRKVQVWLTNSTDE